MTLQRNPPYKRLQYVAKQYGAKHPDVVLDTFWTLSDVVGIEHPETRFDFAQLWQYVARPVPVRNERRVSLWEEGVASSPRGDIVASELLEEALDELKDAPEMKRGRESDALWPWLAKELVRAKKEAIRQSDPWIYIQALNGAAQKGPALALWQQQERIDLGRWKLWDALEALEEFEVALRGVPQGEVVFEWPDGWTVQKLTEPEQLKAEGEVMQHCVGSYCEAVAAGQTDVYSLRDAAGNPHATMEYNENLNRFAQVQGKQNREPASEYMARVNEFAKSRNIQPSELTQKELNAIHEWGVEAAEDAWENASRRRGFSIIEAVDPDVAVDFYSIIEDAFPTTEADDWTAADLESEIESEAQDSASERWYELHAEAMDTLESVIAEVADNAAEEDDPDVETMVTNALDESELYGTYGAEDVRHAVSEVEANL